MTPVCLIYSITFNMLRKAQTNFKMFKMFIIMYWSHWNSIVVEHSGCVVKSCWYRTWHTEHSSDALYDCDTMLILYSSYRTCMWTMMDITHHQLRYNYRANTAGVQICSISMLKCLRVWCLLGTGRLIVESIHNS